MNNKLIILLSLLLYSIYPVGAVIETIGGGSSDVTLNPDYTYISGWVSNYTGNISTLGINVLNPIGTLKVGIYSSGGTNLLSSSQYITANNGWMDIPLNTTVSVTNGTTYLIGVGHTGSTVYYQPSGTNIYYKAGDFPDMTGAYTGENTLNMRINITLPPTPTPTPSPSPTPTPQPTYNSTNLTYKHAYTTNLTCEKIDNTTYCIGQIAVIPYNQDIIVVLLLVIACCMVILTIYNLILFALARR